MLIAIVAVTVTIASNEHHRGKHDPLAATAVPPKMPPAVAEGSQPDVPGILDEAHVAPLATLRAADELDRSGIIGNASERTVAYPPHRASGPRSVKQPSVRQGYLDADCAWAWRRRCSSSTATSIRHSLPIRTCGMACSTNT